ncbi:MAG: PA14 domain-containing protein [Anaerolineae bacterium]
MQERRKLTNLVLALGALALGAIAQGRFVAREPGDALILYLVAVIVFIYAGRPWEKVEAVDTSGGGHDAAAGAEPPTEPVASPWRLRGGIALLLLAMLCSLFALRSFRQVSGSSEAWYLYLTSLVFLVGSFYVWAGSRTQRPWVITSPYWKEAALLAMILLIGAFMRLYKFTALPFGTWYDEADNGLWALKVLNDPSYRPIYIESTNLPAHFVFLIALSFKLLGATTTLAIRAVTVVFGLATVMVAYLLGREFFNRKLALVLAFFLAVSRWDVNFSRIGLHGVTTPFFELAVIYFLLKGLRRKAVQDFVWGGLSLGLGLCFYAPYRLFPGVIALFLLYQVVTRRGFLREHYRHLLVFSLAALLAVAPVLQFACQHTEKFLARTRRTSIFSQEVNQPGWKAVDDNLGKHLLMFNYRGDPNGRHNLPGEPMLDSTTSVLFLISLGYSLYHLRRRQCFLLIIWFAVMLSGGVFSLDFEAPQSLRAIGTLPVAYVLACVVLQQLEGAFTRGWGARGGRYFSGALVFLLAWIGYANFHTYFYRQARDFAVWNAFSTPETLTARAMKAAAGHYDFYVTSLYYQHPTVRFIVPNVVSYKRWDTSDNLPIREPGERPLFILLDAEKRSDFLEAQSYYPDADFEELAPPFGGPTVLYTIRLTGDDLRGVQGLMAYYYRSEEWEGEAALEHQEEPVLSKVEGSLDLNWPGEAPWAGPFSVEWRGVLYAPQYGPYLLRLEAPAEAQLYLDESLLLDGSGVMAQDITLAEGNHALRVRAVGAEGRLRLQWRAPGDEETLVPTWALYRPPVTNNGLLGTYYQNLDWAGPPALARIDPILSMYFHITPLPRPYTVEWQGVISIPYAGVYAFGLESIDDSHLYIDGRLVVEATEPNVYSEGSVELMEGFHDIRLRYTDRSGYSHINLYWTPPGQGRQIVPSQNLYPPQGSYAQAPPPSPPPVASVELGELALDFVSAWGTQGTGPGEFNEPRDIAVDAKGRLYVADTGNRRVQVFDSGGQFIASWDGGEDEFVEPLALVIDSRGDLYVLDSEPGWIYRFAADGTLLGRFAGPEARLFHPRGLTIDEADRLYVADTGGCRVVVYNTAGERLGLFGSKGSGPGQFLEPTDVALDGRGALYVVDSSNQRVQHLDPWGGYRAEWPIPAAGTYNGSHLALAPDGSLLMTAPEQHQIQRYSPVGTLLGQWGDDGTAAGQFHIPVGLAVDQDGNVYVADTLNHRLQKFVLRREE